MRPVCYGGVLMIGYLVRQYNGIFVAGDDASAVEMFPEDQRPEIAFESHKYFVACYKAGMLPKAAEHLV